MAGVARAGIACGRLSVGQMTERGKQRGIKSQMLLILVVIILNLVLGFAAAVLLGYGPPGLAELWVAASGEMAGRRHQAAEVAPSPPAEPSGAQQPLESVSVQDLAEQLGQPSVQHSHQSPAEQPSDPPAEPPSLASEVESGASTEVPAAPLPSAETPEPLEPATATV